MTYKAKIYENNFKIGMDFLKEKNIGKISKDTGLFSNGWHQIQKLYLYDISPLFVGGQKSLHCTFTGSKQLHDHSTNMVTYHIQMSVESSATFQENAILNQF